MTEVRMQVGWIKKISLAEVVTWLSDNIEEGMWDFIVAPGNPFDATPLFTFVDAEDAITFKLKFGL